MTSINSRLQDADRYTSSMTNAFNDFADFWQSNYIGFGRGSRTTFQMWCDDNSLQPGDGCCNILSSDCRNNQKKITYEINPSPGCEVPIVYRQKESGYLTQVRSGESIDENNPTTYNYYIACFRSTTQVPTIQYLTLNDIDNFILYDRSYNIAIGVDNDNSCICEDGTSEWPSWYQGSSSRGNFQVGSTTPDDGAENIPTDTDIKITFTLPVDESSKDEVTISPNSNEEKLKDGEVSGNLLTFKTENLQEGTTYTVTISKDVKSTDGKKLGSDVSFSFTTAGGATPPSGGITITSTPSLSGSVVNVDETLTVNFRASSWAPAGKIYLWFNEFLTSDICTTDLVYAPESTPETEDNVDVHFVFTKPGECRVKVVIYSVVNERENWLDINNWKLETETVYSFDVVEAGSDTGTLVSSSCTGGFADNECTTQSQCSGLGGDWQEELCPQFKRDQYYEQSGGEWYQYDSPGTGRINGDDIRCCVIAEEPPAGENQPPTINITSPDDGATVSGENALISWNANDPDGSITSISLYIDNLLNTTFASDYVRQLSTTFWDSTVYDDGLHIIKLVVEDNEGATGEDSVTVNVNNI
jgi:hypothetical protein